MTPDLAAIFVRSGGCGRRTVEFLAFCADEEGSALEGCASRSNLRNCGDIAWHGRLVRKRRPPRPRIVVVRHGSSSTLVRITGQTQSHPRPLVVFVVAHSLFYDGMSCSSSCSSQLSGLTFTCARVCPLVPLCHPSAMQSFLTKPKTYQLMIKTHKTTIFFPAPQEWTFAQVKEKVLSALTQFGEEQDVPKITSIDDFELCLCRRIDKKMSFELIDPSKHIKEVYVAKPWEYAYIKFRDQETGEWAPKRDAT